jgi:hypothetical protein
MRRLSLLGILLLAGCHNIQGPFQPKPPLRVDDPHISIEEQKRRGRDQLALPDESTKVGPSTGIEPSPTVR